MPNRKTALNPDNFFQYNSSTPSRVMLHQQIRKWRFSAPNQSDNIHLTKSACNPSYSKIGALDMSEPVFDDDVVFSFELIRGLRLRCEGSYLFSMRHLAQSIYYRFIRNTAQSSITTKKTFPARPDTPLLEFDDDDDNSIEAESTEPRRLFLLNAV